MEQSSLPLPPLGVLATPCSVCHSTAVWLDIDGCYYCLHCSRPRLTATHAVDLETEALFYSRQFVARKQRLHT